MRPTRKDRFEKIELKCIICKRLFLREKYLEESRVQQKKLGPVCNNICSGKLGWKIKSDTKRESYNADK